MKYFESYQFLFRSPKWLMNLGLVIVAAFVPIAGPMVILGYHFEIIETLHLRGDKDYPDFDFNRLLNYLLRGAWVFLVQMILSLPLVVLFLPSYFALWLGFMSSLQSRGAPLDPTVATVCMIGGGIGLFIFFLAEILLYLVMVPMSLRAGLAQDFKAAFSWPFIRDYISRMWAPTLLSELFLAATGTVLVLVGLLLFCVPLYPAAALVQFARAYLWYELYQLYLERGGTAIALQVQPAAADTYEDE
jgi:hypothetical protein